MKIKLLPAIVLVCLFLVNTRPALAVEIIGWENLVPPVDESLDPYPRLDEDQQNSLYDLWMVRETRKIGSTSEVLEQKETDAIANLKEGGFNAETVMRELDAFLEILEANKTRLVEDLDGKDVRIPGYVLPTEYSDDQVVEFLLVPYVGACVHTPTPPLNQLVHVKVEDGFASEGLFAPVWVTGQMRTALTTQDISFTDGDTSVEAGYQINASDVVAYD